MDQKSKNIFDEYLDKKHDFIMLGDVVSNLLRAIVAQSGVQVLTIEHRVKEASSLEGKLALKGEKYNSLADITDILGARVVCLFADDVDYIAKFIERTFVIDNENSVDKRAQLDPTAFGYLSLHFICSLPFDKKYPDEICGKKFEIQLRSALQHTWSALFHDIGYKSDFDLPRHVVRDYSRLAGLLELADEKFVYIRDYMSNYSAEVREKIANNQCDNLDIDMVSLQEYMRRNIDMQSLLGELAAICGSEINDVNPEAYISQLAWLGKKTLGDLHQMLNDNHDTAVQLAKHALEGSELDILSSTVGFRFLCQAELLRAGYSEERIAEFLALSSGNKARAQSGAAALLRRGAAIQGCAKMTPQEAAIYRRALDYATQKHSGQIRIGGAPYITHPVAVAQMVREHGYGLAYQITALFHDLLEDTDATNDELVALSNAEVAHAVSLLTKQKGYDMQKYIDGICANPMAKAVKAADRLHNLRCALLANQDFKRRYILETLDWYMDFSPEIPAAVIALVQSLELPTAELSILNERIEAWKAKCKA